jgi:hypothetical protein
MRNSTTGELVQTVEVVEQGCADLQRLIPTRRKRRVHNAVIKFVGIGKVRRDAMNIIPTASINRTPAPEGSAGVAASFPVWNQPQRYKPSSKNSSCIANDLWLHCAHLSLYGV